MKTVADTLGVSRSNLTERINGTSKPRGCYRKAEDVELLPYIRKLVDERPTYGYLRIAALLNRECQAQGLPGVNCKRLHRIMAAANAMVLQKHTALRHGRVHDGKVMVMRSNLRWCSDALEFSRWNGEVVRLAFIIDAFNREIISWVAIANGGISGSDIRDMMLGHRKALRCHKGPEPDRTSLRQRQCLYRKGNQVIRAGAQPDAVLHSGSEPTVKRHVGSIHQNPETR